MRRTQTNEKSERESFNGKRKLKDAPQTPDEFSKLSRLAAGCGYGGNPEHKRNPGDFGLSPPSAPKPGKTLCDGVSIFKRAEALRLLRLGLSKGMVSVQERGPGWPQNVWVVTSDGVPLEAELEQQENGTYHGYPMPLNDPFRDEVLQRWEPDD